MRNLLLIASFVASACFAGDWKQLYDGKDLDGWKHVGPGQFVVENGLLKTEGGMGLLYFTGEKFGNATLRVVFKTGAKNSQFRCIRPVARTATRRLVRCAQRL